MFYNYRRLYLYDRFVSATQDVFNIFGLSYPSRVIVRIVSVSAERILSSHWLSEISGSVGRTQIKNIL